MKLREARAKRCLRWKIEGNDKFELHTWDPPIVWWKQRKLNFTAGSNLHLRTSLNEKFELLQELNLEILELSKEEDIKEEIETADVFQNRVKFVIAQLDALFLACFTSKVEPILSTPNEPTSENGHTETVSAQIALTHISASPQPQAVSPRVKLPNLELKKFDGDVAK